MGRNLIVFSDGTGNSAANTDKTNVWRLYDALDRSDVTQLATFDDGVGTSSFAPMRYLGLALGIGVKRNVLDLYKFICRNYRDDDQIFAFGFSRGAFTIRVLAGMIAQEGLVEYRSDEQLERDALAAYRKYRADAFEATILVKALRGVRDRFVALRDSGRQSDPPRKAKVRFLGLWDIVGAYGLPIDELTIAVDRWVWPMRFASDDLPDAVAEYARHAMSLDDERRTFHPLPWTETGTAWPQGQSLNDAKRLQAWFAGVHANVGGGYPDDRLSYVPLCWMIDEARRFGVRFDEAKVRTYAAVAADGGPIYDSRQGVWTLYRYQPRSLKRLMRLEDTAVTKAPPLVHHSVIRRIADGADYYAPISVDTNIDILAENNEPMHFAWTPETPAMTPTARAINRLLQEPGDVAARRALHAARRSCTERALDLVWWRRVFYFIMLFLVVVLAAFPWTAGALDLAVLKAANGYLSDALSPLFSLTRLVIPAMAESWVTAIEAHSVLGLALLLLLISAYRFSTVLQLRIHDWSAAGWTDGLRDRAMQLDRQYKAAQVLWYKRVTMALPCLAVAAVAVGSVVPGLTRAGWLAFAGALVAAGVTGSVWIGLMRQARNVGDRDMPRWATLQFANWCRTSQRLVGAYRTFAMKVLPDLTLILAGLVLFWVVAMPLALQAYYHARLAYGDLCTGVGDGNATNLPTPAMGETRSAAKLFTTNSMCWASGIQLEKGQHYIVQLEIGENDPDWFDRSTHTDVLGFPAESLIHGASLLSKRWLGQNWFKPIARIGSRGTTETPLEPYDPVGPVVPLLGRQATYDSIMQEDATCFWCFSQPISARAAKDATVLYKDIGGRRRILRAKIDATKDGELFLYVNDAWPNLLVDTYANNTGSAKVTVEHLK